MEEVTVTVRDGEAVSRHLLQGCMSQWPSTRARLVLAALIKIGWVVKRQTGSHKVLSRPGWPDVTFAFHDKEELGPSTPAFAPRTCRPRRTQRGW
jgi:predicted RNA binding protein YcfA (HicA-like mRNA interferase family)